MNYALPAGTAGYSQGLEDSRREDLARVAMLQHMQQSQLFPLQYGLLSEQLKAAQTQNINRGLLPGAIEQFAGLLSPRALAAPQQGQNPMIPGLPTSSVMAGSGTTTPTPGAAPVQPQQAAGPDQAQVMRVLANLKLLGVDLTDVYKAAQPKINVTPSGIPWDEKTGAMAGAPLPVVSEAHGGYQLQSGPGGFSMAPIPGAAPLALAAKRQGEQARAEFDLVTVADGKGGTISMPRSQAIARLGGAPAGATAAAPGVGGLPPSAGGITGALGYERPKAQTEGDIRAAQEFISEMRQNYAKLRDSGAFLANIEKAKALATGEAAQFMGPFGEMKLNVTKFMRANIPGMANLNTEGVADTAELRTRLFQQVMENLKKMDAQPSTYQQQMMEKAFGTLGEDPQAVANILSVFGDITRARVDVHNATVADAERRGVSFPHDIRVKIAPQRGDTTTPLSAAERKEYEQLLKRFGRGQR